VAEGYRIPYFTITPTFSVCPVHGYIPGNHPTCPLEAEAREKTDFKVVGS
jgi:ribonucleoside-triphosphate reductase